MFRKLLITIIFVAIAVCLPGNVSFSSEKHYLSDYVSYFYNRYSKQFDRHGLVFQAPDYGVKNFKTAKNAREIMSLATYYKYRALSGEKLAQNKIKEAVLRADYELTRRPTYTQSFEDAAAQFLMIRMIEQLPNIFSSDAKNLIYKNINKRMEDGIKINDTSNRAALSGVYWQYVVNHFYDLGLIDKSQKRNFDDLIKTKMNSLIKKGDVDNNGWYKEGDPKRFNPHYHVITAMSFAAYAEETGDQQFLVMALKMTSNLRKVTFINGMVEAALGDRPVGLGAQFYLGAGLLNYRFGYPDYLVYLSYASGNRFFSDRRYPDRLEYHSTISGKAPNFHDDYAFSNLAELALALSLWQKMPTDFFKDQAIGRIYINSGDGGPTVYNWGNAIWFDGIKWTLSSSGDSSNWRIVR